MARALLLQRFWLIDIEISTISVFRKAAFRSHSAALQRKNSGVFHEFFDEKQADSELKHEVFDSWIMRRCDIVDKIL